MKKLLLITLSFLLVNVAFSQSITDKDTYVQVVHQDGTTIAIGKSQVESLKIQGSRVYIMTSRRWSTDQLTRILYLQPAEFGFSTATDLFNYLSLMFFKAYKVQYHYTSGLVDTVSYYVGDSLAFKTAYSYSGSVVSEKSAPINE